MTYTDVLPLEWSVVAPHIRIATGANVKYMLLHANSLTGDEMWRVTYCATGSDRYIVLDFLGTLAEAVEAADAHHAMRLAKFFKPAKQEDAP